MRIVTAVFWILTSWTGSGSSRETSPGPAWPISPTPLRVLCTEADAIVVARVGAPGDDSDSTVAAGEIRWRAGLHVERVLKGDPGAEIVKVSSLGTVCPSPVLFLEGDEVIAFLEGGDAGWFTSSLSYGLKSLDEDARAVYQERIAEFLQLANTPDEGDRRTPTVEWLLRCCEHPATCWEGAYELCRAGDSMSRYDRREDPGFGKDLTPAQLARLRQSLEGRTELGRGEFCLVELFTGLSSVEEPAKDWLLPLLLDQLRNIDLD